MTNDNTNTAEVKMHHATRAKMEKLQAMLSAEYPALTVTPIADEIGKLDHFVTRHTVPSDIEGKDLLTNIVLNTKKVPELSDIFGACEDLDLDPEAIEVDEDTGPTSSIVPEVYRKAYRENSTTGRSCGDWLAERLATDTLREGAKLDADAFTEVLVNNGVDMSGKWAQARFDLGNGGAGRYRMNGRQVLEKTVAKAGKYFDHNNNQHPVSAKWLTMARAKHAKWLAKQVKIEENAKASVKEAVEGK